jgi:hypothetical protein
MVAMGPGRPVQGFPAVTWLRRLGPLAGSRWRDGAGLTPGLRARGRGRLAGQADVRPGRRPRRSRRAGPFAAKFDGTDSVVARTEVEALAADRVLTEGDRLAGRSRRRVHHDGRTGTRCDEHGGDGCMPALPLKALWTAAQLGRRYYTAAAARSSIRLARASSSMSAAIRSRIAATSPR